MADAETSENNIKPASLFFSYGKVYVWNADEIFIIRSKHRIVGSLIGSLPRKPRQNNVFSLPLLLSREEATLLLEKGFAQIYEMPKTIPLPCSEEVERFKELRQHSMLKQIECFEMMLEEKKIELADVIEEGRRLKREQPALELRESMEKLNNESDDDKERNKGKGRKAKKNKMKRKCEFEIVAGDGKEEEVLSKKMKSGEMHNEVFDQDSHNEGNATSNLKDNNNVDVDYHKSADGGVSEVTTETCLGADGVNSTPTAVTVCEDSNLSEAGVDSLSASSEITNEDTTCLSDQGTLIHIPTVLPQRLMPVKQAEWIYPQTDSEKLHYRVFLDLWEKGYYLTSAVNFGGDFLAYPGDPMKYHSFYIVIIIPWGRKIRPFDIISAGRLGASVKKTALLCSVEQDTNTIVYVSVKWSGIS
ncbi:tRNA-splicing endonuclease subunit Sen34 [Acropora cervicornis]|uniref:tRNA-splicing endonuclease subunit SEN34 n=1 Tax=Acropora cervicornis TaxID=6130 RepID=A0AAD9QWF7_ACRCE|nr:tRNA-splicing endonuclease subunit Sen34 [Acropora cervicornis]